MEEYRIILRDYLLLATEFLAAIVGTIYLTKKNNSYWKIFSLYLLIIFVQEFFWRNNPSIDTKLRISYYVFLGIPLQYLFMFWLYAFKSLQKKVFFWVISSIYIVVIIVVSCFKKQDAISFISNNIGTFILIVLLILEFIKQVQTDEILRFKENKMFYINLGLILFYIGSYPFQVFGKELNESYPLLWNYYYGYTLIANCLMYLLFAASFIWGKTR